jgi:hypothetical protein
MAADPKTVSGISEKDLVKMDSATRLILRTAISFRTLVGANALFVDSDRTGSGGKVAATSIGEMAYLLAEIVCVQLQQILEHRGIVNLAPIGALARLGIARAYAVQGDTVKAEAAYQDFLRSGKTPTPASPSSSPRKPNTPS